MNGSGKPGSMSVMSRELSESEKKKEEKRRVQILHGSFAESGVPYGKVSETRTQQNIIPFFLWFNFFSAREYDYLRCNRRG